MKKNIKLIVSALCALVAFGCSEADKMEYGKEVLVMTGTDKDAVVTFAIDDLDPSSYTYPVTVSATGKVAKRTTVQLKVDPSLVEKYNSENNTNYFPLPESAVELSTPNVVIEAGKASSSIAYVTIVDDSTMEEGRLYMIPVTIVSNDAGMDSIEASRTVYLRISRTLGFMSLNIANQASGTNGTMYSNFIFDDSLAVDLNNFTYEIKVYIADFRGNRTGTICRLCSWTAKDESRSLMLRFNENGTPAGSLQAVAPGGGIVTTTLFEEKRWYMLSFTYDGSAFRIYVDGVRDSEDSADHHNTFQRFELGMSWGGYYSSQEFRGRIAEVRVWNRARTAGQIQSSMCNVDPQSEGLVAYWRMNEGQGHIFYDRTGHGYDMDWSQTVRDTSENGNLVATPNAATRVDNGWVEDTNNRCVN